MQKIRAKLVGSALLGCHPLRFHEKNYEKRNEQKIRENTTVLQYWALIYCDFTRKNTK